LVFSRILRVGAYIKDDVSDLLEQRGKMMRKLFLEISYRSHLALADLEYLQIHELDMALRHGIESSFIKARQVITVLFYQQRKLKVLEGKNASRFLRQGSFQELKDDQHVQIIKGNSASFGKVKGRVVVALESFIAIQKMKKGNILVSPYTAVEYLPAMRLAAAIITDTGGITSHAAIVSREFKIPCIIGTKIATKVLKDGDLVEVDADKGIVRIL
jgi:phosphoenolpyruvate synthase/pyruvate phosphate dikinase